jgi:endonuclease YncB( thermonuclease family)
MVLTRPSRRRRGGILVATALATLVAASGDAGMRDVLAGPVAAEVVEVVDGDTIAVRARIWLGQELETRVRLAGIDTPELHGKCARERRLAAAARDFVRTRLAAGAVALRDVQFGKYAGRVVARVTTADGEDVGAALIGAGLARAYDGGTRLGWCE